MTKINIGTNASMYRVPITFVGALVRRKIPRRRLSEFAKTNPFVLTMPDSRYWSVVGYLGKAWDARKKLKN